MKKRLLTILSAVASVAMAQIPNPGFEQVTTQAGLCNTGGASVTAPTGWLSSPNTNASTTVAHSGTKAALIASFGGQPEALETFDCTGFTPFFTYTTSIPGAMTAWVRRATAISTDTLGFTVGIYDSGNNPIAAGGLQLTGPGYTAYTQITVTMTPVGTGTPAKGLIGITGSAASNSSWYVDDLAFTTVGIAGYEAANFNVFYANENIVVEGSKEQSASVSIYDLVGKQITRTNLLAIVPGNALRINTSGLPAGVYLVQVNDANGVLATRRMVIQ